VTGDTTKDPVLRFVLGDQLDRRISSLADLDLDRDVILLCEVAEEATYVRHHKQKIAFLFSAMRHFAAALEAEGATVDYVRLDDPDNAGSFTGELARAAARHRPDRVVLTEPSEWRVMQAAQRWTEVLGVPVEIREDDRFFASRERFRAWAARRRTLRMEHFYREMRVETGFLMSGGEPVGGAWNYDRQNRKRLPKHVQVPAREATPPDRITLEVIDLVEHRFGDHFGTLDAFHWPVTRAEALLSLERFVTTSLPRYGDYQDAMAAAEATLFHSLLSPLLNCGLLSPREVCERVVAAYGAGAAPLNSVEGFLRQILGWREFIRGIYWLRMPGYAETNALGARRRLPSFYWTADTKMACMRSAVRQTRDLAYAHHIQRLMVTGNFALLAGISPREIEEWYLIAYADAYDWVELPNVHGMAIYADGGVFASKPYAASGNYIDRMSDYCRGCAYDVKQRTGEQACPFNYLYWNFLVEHEATLRGNPRMSVVYGSLDRMEPGRVATIRADAARFLEAACGGEPPPG